MVLSVQTLFNQTVLVIEHIVYACFAHVPSLLFLPVYGIAEIFVISAHGLRNGAASATRSKEMTYDFLARANLCKGPVDILVEINSQRFLCRR